MSYFLSPQKLVIGRPVFISGEEFSHITFSRRMKSGDKIELQDEDGHRCIVKVDKITKSELVVLPLEIIEGPEEPECEISLVVALPKPKYIAGIVESGTVLGAKKVLFFGTSHSPVSKSAFNIERLTRVASESAKQCGRAKIPEIEFLDSEDAALRVASAASHSFLLDRAGSIFPDLNPPPTSIAILIGPEGGFDTQFLQKTENLKNLTKISLGPRILKTEAATHTSLSIIGSHYGDIHP